MKEIIDSAIKYLSAHPDVVVNIGITFMGVVISAIITSIVTCKAVDWLRCRTARRVAKAIMLTFKEEIKIGVDVLDEYIKNGSSVVMMPTQTFELNFLMYLLNTYSSPSDTRQSPQRITHR